MSTTIKYDKKDMDRLTKFEWAGRGDTVGGLRSIKLARPICQEGCQGSLDTELTWYLRCTHGPKEKDGSPYWRMRQHVKKVQVLDELKDDDGNGTGQYVGSTQTRVYFTLEPNITEVVYSISHDNGEGPQIAMDFKGFKMLPDIGVAPMCELKGCGKAWPTFGTEFGNYCSEEHALYVGARLQGIFLPANNRREAAFMLKEEVRV